ncbi:unnamed protein product [Moneuplotes crassus]|uniref:Uncharacterized protein n=1 Tax=Euplotes crassus TaxID=5936 RepID=A0AAD1U4D3_EUPCR|nr:unnamed protein product [Moneuplotes crassus]
MVIDGSFFISFSFICVSSRYFNLDRFCNIGIPVPNDGIVCRLDSNILINRELFEQRFILIREGISTFNQLELCPSLVPSTFWFHNRMVLVSSNFIHSQIFFVKKTNIIESEPKGNSKAMLSWMML